MKAFGAFPILHQVLQAKTGIPLRSRQKNAQRAFAVQMNAAINGKGGPAFPSRDFQRYLVPVWNRELLVDRIFVDQATNTEQTGTAPTKKKFINNLENRPPANSGAKEASTAAAQKREYGPDSKKL